jgi:hypothetical protein
MHRLLKSAIQKVAIVQFRKTAYESYEGGDVVTKVPYNDDGRPIKPEYEKKSPPEKDMLGKSKKILDDVMSLPESERQDAANLANAKFRGSRPLLYYLSLKTYPNNRDMIQEYLHENTGTGLDYLDIFVLFTNSMTIAWPSIIKCLKERKEAAKYFMHWYFEKYGYSLFDTMGRTIDKHKIVSLFIDPSESDEAKTIALNMLPLPKDEQRVEAKAFLQKHKVSLFTCLEATDAIKQMTREQIYDIYGMFFKLAREARPR